MLLVFQILIGLICVALLGLGAMSMFAPKRMVKNFAIEPQGSAGLNTIRGVIGGVFVASLSMLVAGLITGETLWFLAVGVILGIVAFGRIVGILSDGFESSVVPPLILEFVMVAILVSAHLQLGAT